MQQMPQGQREIDFGRLQLLQKEKAKLFERLQQIEQEERRLLQGIDDQKGMVEAIASQNQGSLASLTLQVQSKTLELNQLNRNCEQMRKTVAKVHAQQSALANQAHEQLKLRRGFYDRLAAISDPTNHK